MKRLSKKTILATAVLSLCALLAPAHADEDSGARPMIAIIIDDLGNQRKAGERAIALPGPVTCAIIPRTAYSTYLAEEAFRAGKEVMLHLPMQAVGSDYKASPDQIDIDTSRAKLRRTLNEDLTDVPHASGVNNHMGSLITRHPGHMEWLMDELLLRGDLFFVDSYTTAASVALTTAREKGVPSVRRHVFLDNDASGNIEKEFARLKRKARKRGFAVGIGHPYRATLEFLERELPLLEAEGYELVSVEQIIERQQATSEQKAVALHGLSSAVDSS